MKLIKRTHQRTTALGACHARDVRKIGFPRKERGLLGPNRASPGVPYRSGRVVASYIDRSTEAALASRAELLAEPTLVRITATIIMQRRCRPLHPNWRMRRKPFR